MKRENLIAYAASFVSFLLDEDVAKDIDRIVLFGSVARGIIDRDSDIDVFVDTRKGIEREIQSIVTLFRRSESHRKWELKGLQNELSVKTGELKKWKLRRDVLSDGILLYGKMKDSQQDTHYYLLVKPSFKKFGKSQQIKIWRRLYGYRQKVGSKTYKTAGLVEKLGGKRIENGIIIPMENKKDILEFLGRERISYTVNEIWSDTL